MDNSGPVFFLGQHESQRNTPVGPGSISQAQDSGYDFITAPITTAAFHETITGFAEQLKSTLPPLAPDDTTLEPKNSNQALVGVVSPWIDLGSSEPVIASISRQVLNTEVAYAAFCGINNLIVHGPTANADVVQYARDIREALGLGPYLHLHILLPLGAELENDYTDYANLSELAQRSDLEREDDTGNSASDDDAWKSWESWHTIQTICSYSQKLSVALEIPRQLPMASPSACWFSEPIRMLMFPRTTFLRNAKGYPVFSKQHQQLVSRFARLRFPPWLILCDVQHHAQSGVNGANEAGSDPTPAEAALTTKAKPNEDTNHLRYLRHLQQSQPPRPPIELFGQGYEDFLQSPLQPLTDNLESITYEGFEKDPVKYEWYERAISAALKHLTNVVGVSRDIVVAVAGAGRGPLVTRALQASKKSGIDIQCWAVEKNPNAFVLLQRKNANDSLWSGQVQIVKSDMRHWQGPETAENTTGKVDILVSELLGSFADNELSPECLDGVQHVLHPEHGINIPQSYSAHLTPIATPRLHSDLLGRGGTEKWELPYVVMLHQYDYLCTSNDSHRKPDVKEAWSFSHPLPEGVLEHSRSRAGSSNDGGGWAGGDGTNEHNTRTCKVSFTAHEQGVCHGLAGYFEAVLYADDNVKVEISTNPETMEEKSKDMISWFPIFFPLKTPIYTPARSKIEVSMWRQTDDRSVWYEWLVGVFDKRDDGRTRRIAMSELHSSRKNACLT